MKLGAILTIILLSVLHIDAQRRRQKISDVNELLYTAEYINGKYIPKDMKDAFKIKGQTNKIDLSLRNHIV